MIYDAYWEPPSLYINRRVYRSSIYASHLLLFHIELLIFIFHYEQGRMKVSTSDAFDVCTGLKYSRGYHELSRRAHVL